MPQRSQHPLVYILLIWISIITIIQLLFITLFFTREQSSNSSNLEKPSTLPVQSISYPIEIVNFQAQDTESPKRTPTWVEQTKSDLTTNGSGESIQLMKEGNYILNFRVTLCSSGRTNASDILPVVTLKLQGRSKLIGWINKESQSTGLLSKAIHLALGTPVVITIDPPACINTSIMVTHLDIIYLNKLQSLLP